MPINYKFYSGFSSSDSVGKDGTYLYSENIDSTNPEYIQVSPKTQTLLTSEEKISYLAFNPFSHREEDNYAYVYRYKVYDKNKNVIYDHIAKYNITNFNGYNRPEGEGTIEYRGLALAILIYGRTSDLLFYGPGVEVSVKGNKFKKLGFFRNIDKGDGTPMYFFEADMYTFYFHDVISIGHGSILLTNSRLFQYDEYGNKLYTTEGMSAVSVNSASNGYKVYSRDGKLRFIGFLENNKAKVNDNYSLDLRIISVKSYSGLDYIFASEGLFFLNGIVASPIAYTNKSNYLDFEKFKFFYDLKWGYIRHDKFIYSITKTKKGFDLNVLGSSAVGSPINFSSIVSKENWEDVSSMIEYKDGVLISYKDKNGTYGIDYFSFKNEEKNEKGYLITKEYVGDGQIFLKKAKSLKFFCDKLKENEYLKIFASINNGDFEEIKTLTSEDRWKNGFFEVLSFNKEFHKIVFKLELKGSFKLYDFIFLDDKIK